MCKVVRYRFFCGHAIGVCRSRCLATVRKYTKPACSSEPYITLNLTGDCSNCLHDSWETNWNQKLCRARAFHKRLKEQSLPGAEEIVVLVANLEREYENTAWRQNKLTPHAHDKSGVVKRSKVPFEEERKQGTVVSPLRQEVHPCEIVLLQRSHKDWTEGDYDESYIPYTDPLHPIDITYTHPLDGTDESWLLQYFSEEELSSMEDELESDDSVGTDWDWGGGGNTIGPSNVWANVDLTETSTLTDVTGSTDYFTQTDQHTPLVTEAISSFWQTVNSDTESKSHPQHQNQKHGFAIATSKSPSYVSDAFANHIQADGSPDLAPSYATLPKRLSTLAKYERMRKSLQEIKYTDHTLYFSNWLQISRMEIKEFARISQARIIEDPRHVFRGVG